MEPVPAGAAPTNAIFVDSSNNNSFANKTDGGTTIVVVQETANILFKQMQAGEDLAKGWPLAKQPSGKVVRFDANDPNRKAFCAYSMETVAQNAPVNTLLVGANLTDALIGLGFAPGDEVYLNTSGGYTNDPSTIESDPTADIIKVGVADCSGGAVASATVKDLIAFPEVISRA